MSARSPGATRLSCGSRARATRWGLRNTRDLRLPRRRAPARLRRRHGQELRAAEPAMTTARPLPTVVCGRLLGRAATGPRQSRGRPTRGRAPQDNPRFVVTNLRQTPRFLYERMRPGGYRNRIKELHDGLSSGGRAVVGSGRINCASSSPPRPMCSCKNCGYARRAPAARAELAAGPAAQTRRPCRCVGTPYRPAPAHRDARPARVAAHRPRARRSPRIGPTPAPAFPNHGPCHRSPGGAVRTIPSLVT